MYKSEKQFTRNASKLPVEEIFTSVDLDRGQEWDPNLGFNFQYPQRWVSDPSQKKAIGIRRLQVTPSAHVFKIGCAVGLTANDAYNALTDKTGDPEKSDYKCVVLSITSNNTIDEIMTEIIREFKFYISDIQYSLNYRYDYKTGELELRLEDDINDEVSGYFCMYEYFETDEFLKFLNQEVVDNASALYNPEQRKIFRGVWNRENLYFHTSFSNSKLHFLGMNGDHFDDPSVFYQYSTNSNDFRVWFTTDLVHKIIPRHCEFILQLCFVVNINSYNT